MRRLILISGATGSTPQHRLSEVDAESRTARCAVCGPVDVAKTGNRPGWQCGPANRARAAAWRKEHPEREAASKAAYKEANPERWQGMRQAVGSRYYEKNRDAINERARQTTAQLRAEVVAVYGGRCACPGCHVHHAELLTVDHVDGGGGAHRRALKTRGSKDFYRWLKQHGFPPDYQLLCGSCNLAKSDKDKCPLAGQEH
jgi:hypothetical protein